jgi:polyisoprenoid-binding protein YceI
MGARCSFRKLNTMKKNTLLFLLVSLAINIYAQERFGTKTGVVNFEASVPSFEEVKATHNSVSALLTSNGDFASIALVRGFRFKVALMEEHFNENYAESSKYPKVKFKGKIQNFDSSKLSDVEKEYIISGTISMHGQEKEIETIAYLKEIDNLIGFQTTFTIKPEDFNIEIPSLVSNKIAEEINISTHFKFREILNE